MIDKNDENAARQSSQYKDYGKRAPAVDIEKRSDGSLILTSPYAPLPRARSVAHILIDRAHANPDRTLLAERDHHSGEWQHLSYGEAVENCRRLAKGLIDRGLGPDHRVMILSPRSFGHFAMAFGSMMARVPVSPVSAPYSLLSQDHAKLKHVASLLQPSIILIDDLETYEPAVQSLFDEGLVDAAEIVLANAPDASIRTWNNLSVSRVEDWYDNSTSDAVDGSIDSIDHETVARYMFTSGSTGTPKAVIYTQGMMCAQMAQMAGLNRPDADFDPDAHARVLDWMPWSHTGAGVMRLNAMIAAGGSIYFDTGRPVPGEYEETLRNLREVQPTSLAGAPVGYAMLADALEKDDDLNRLIFSNVTTIGFGSAAMPPSLFERLQNLSLKATGRRVGVTSSLASTEVIGCLSVYWPMEDSNNLGLPIPGNFIKLVPNGSKLEIRVKGNTVTPGYYKDPQRTAASFDEEGFFKMGDAVRFIDPAEPTRGLAFDGRIAEQFKLSTGTWVSAGTLRTKIVAATSPYVSDAVICGLNQPFIAVMLWPNLGECARDLKLDQKLPEDELRNLIAGSPDIVKRISEGLQKHNSQNSGSSTRVVRFALLGDQPSADALEITEKGYVNQRVAIERRPGIVQRLYNEQPEGNVHTVE